MRITSSLLAAVLLLPVAPAHAADIALVDFADEWTEVDALRQTLDAFGYPYDDLTEDLFRGELPLHGHTVFFIGSMTTNSPTLLLNLERNAGVIQDYVRRGGVVIEPTQADQNEATVQWLPPSLSCVRGDTDSAELSLVAADHPLFHTPNELSEEDFAGWGFSGWPTVWEAIASQEGFEVLAESAGMSVIMEAKYGGGAFVLMSLAPDTYHVVGNDAFTRNKAGLFMQNILSLYAERVVVTGSCPGSMSLDMRGLTAGGPWTLMSGLGYGSTTLADGHCSGTETGLGGTLRQIDGIADPYGRYRLDFDAPPAACGTRLQLLDLASCELSSVYGL